MKKTVIYLLKENCIKALKKEPQDPSERDLGYSDCLKNIINLCDDYLFEVEKELVAEFWDRGIEAMSKRTIEVRAWLDFDDYYEQNYMKCREKLQEQIMDGQ